MYDFTDTYYAHDTCTCVFHFCCAVVVIPVSEAKGQQIVAVMLVSYTYVRTLDTLEQSCMQQCVCVIELFVVSVCFSQAVCNKFLPSHDEKLQWLKKNVRKNCASLNLCVSLSITPT